MTLKSTDQNICLIRFSLHYRFNGDGIKLQTFVNNYLRHNIMSTRQLRPWFAKHKISMDNFSQKIGPNIYLKGTEMY